MEQKFRSEWSKPDGLSLEHNEFFERSIMRAQHLLLTAVSALSVLRWLQVPAVQINVAKNQVNVMQAGSGSAEGTP